MSPEEINKNLTKLTTVFEGIKRPKNFRQKICKFIDETESSCKEKLLRMSAKVCGKQP